MGLVTPDGHLSLILLHAQTILANSATLRTLVGEVDTAGARSKILFFEQPQDEEGEIERPLIILRFGDEMEFTAEGQTGPYWSASGNWQVFIEIDVTEANQVLCADAVFGFTNVIGQIMDEVFMLAGRTNPEDENYSFQNITGCRIHWGPKRVGEQEKGASGDDDDYMQIVLEFDYN